MRVGGLVKDGSALERRAEVDRAMIDKTGTLTLGRPVATNLDEADASVRALLLALARASRHPLSEALTRDLTAAGVTPVTVEAIRETPGFGVEALWNGRKVTLGRPAQPLADSALATQLALDGAPALGRAPV